MRWLRDSVLREALGSALIDSVIAVRESEIEQFAERLGRGGGSGLAVDALNRCSWREKKSLDRFRLILTCCRLIWTLPALGDWKTACIEHMFE